MHTNRLAWCFPVPGEQTGGSLRVECVDVVELGMFWSCFEHDNEPAGSVQADNWLSG